MNREQKFFNALRDVFVGAKVEGESGFINLMRIKARYYENGVFPKLHQDVEKALKPFPAFREELFDKLYDFFHRYFSESGSIYFRYTPLHQNVYENGKAQEGGTGISHFCKYYQLEQYEDALRRVRYEDADLFEDPNRDPYQQYVFLRDLKMLEALEVDTKKNTVKVDLDRLYGGIDVAETLSNLAGKWIKRITADSVEFEDGEVVDTKNLDWRRIKPLIWW